MKKLAIVITDGIGYRNFILSDFIFEAKKRFDDLVIFSCLPESTYADLDLGCKIVELEVFEETFSTWFFRKLKEITHLRLFAKKNFGIQDSLNINYPKVNNPRGISSKLIFAWSKFISSEKWIQWYNRLQQNTFKSNKITIGYTKLLKEEKISELFFTHQRPPYIAPLIYSAEKLKINTSTFIFSWDNLASKGRMAGNFNHYLVWSELMQDELLHFYKKVRKDQISVVGTPQFEPYKLKRYGYSKEELINRFGMDKEKPIILFTCNDSSSENDPIYLEILANFIQEKKLVKEVNLLVRTSPAEEPERFENIKKKYGFIKWNHPKWFLSRKEHQESWSQRVPTITDVNDLKSILNHCDFTINVLSTITLDSYLFDKPVINPVFGNTENDLFDDQKFLRYQHLENLVDSNSSCIVTSESDYLEAINMLLTTSGYNKKEREDFLKLQIGAPVIGTSERIANSLYSLDTNKTDA